MQEFELTEIEIHYEPAKPKKYRGGEPYRCGSSTPIIFLPQAPRIMVCACPSTKCLIWFAVCLVIFVVVSDRVMVYYGVSFGAYQKMDEQLLNIEEHPGEMIREFEPLEIVYLDPENETRYPILVWWIPFTGYKRIVHKCKLGSCLFTHSRTELDNPLTEGIMFYGSRINWKDLPLPRNPSHLWNLIHEESPKNDLLLATPEAMSLFNYTATCSRSSSYPLVTQYLESIGHILTPVKYPASEKSKNGLGLAMYLHSDCGIPSDRDGYVTILMKYMKVDSYGKCLNNKKLPEHLLDPVTGMDSPDLYDIIGKYKFVLSFENAICDDYITEKLWRTFKAGSVPVYKGSPSVMDWAPDQHSIILVDDFASPKELADYLKYLDENDEEYEKYFAYKKGVTNQRLTDHMSKREWFVNDHTGMKLNFIEGFECNVCDRIHERKRMQARGLTLPQVIANRSHYNYSDVKPSVKITTSSEQYHHPGRQALELWKFQYECLSAQAKAIVPVIQRGGDSQQVNDILSNGCNNLVNIPEDWMINTD